MDRRRRNNKRAIGSMLAELDNNGGNLSQTSRELKVPISTVKSWRDNYSHDPIVAKYRSLKNEELAERFRVVSAMALNRLRNEIADVSVDKLATVAAIGADKHLLLTGQPTEITGSANSKSAKQLFIEQYRAERHATQEQAEAAANAAFDWLESGVADETQRPEA